MAKNRSTVLGIGCGCLVLFLSCAGAGVAGFLAVTGVLKNSEPYHEALARAGSDSRVIAELGPPVEPGWWVSGSVSVSTNNGRSAGHAMLTIPVHGPKKSGTITVVGAMAAGHWNYSRLSFDIDGATVDLLEPDSGDGATPQPTATEL